MSVFALDGIAPDLADDVWIAPDAHVIGQVVLGQGASVWFGAVLRGDNEPITIGSGTNLQEGCILHTDIGHPLVVGRDCTIGHRVTLHGCTIGDETLVGMGATILNGAVIGRNCLIGAGALVTEDKEIPDGSLVVGAPGRVVRRLDDAEIARVRQSARNYRANAARFCAGLVRI